MQIKPADVNVCCLIGHMITMGVTLYISLPRGGHPEVIQEYQVGNQCLQPTNQTQTPKLVSDSHRYIIE